MQNSKRREPVAASFLHSAFFLLPSPRGHRPAQFHRATGGNRQRCKPPNGFQQSQVIRRIHLYHRRVKKLPSLLEINLKHGICFTLQNNFIVAR